MEKESFFWGINRRDCSYFIKTNNEIICIHLSCTVHLRLHLSLLLLYFPFQPFISHFQLPSTPSTPSNNLNTHLLQILHQIHNTLLQAPKLQSQHTSRPRIIKLINSSLRIPTTLHLFPGQLSPILREILPNNLTNLFIAKIPLRDEKSLPRRLRNLNRFHMRQCQIPHVDPDKCSRARDFLFPFPLQDIAHALVRCV